MLKCAFVWHFNQHIAHRESAEALDAMLDTFDDVPVTLDISGTFLQGLPWEAKDTFSRLCERVEDGKIEILHTSFGQHIMSYFPKNIDEMHIKAHKKALSLIPALAEKKYPRGFWIPERVWKPSLGMIIRRWADYTLIDIPVFIKGNPNKNPYCPYKFQKLTIFNIHDFPEWLDRNAKSPEEIADNFVARFLKEIEPYEDKDAIAIFATDGEIFRLGITAIDLKFDADKYMGLIIRKLEKQGIEITTPSLSRMKAKEEAYYPEGTYNWLGRACKGSYDNWMICERAKTLFEEHVKVYRKMRAIEKKLSKESARRLMALSWRIYLSSQFEFGWDGCGQFETVWNAWLWGNEIWHNVHSALGLGISAELCENMSNLENEEKMKLVNRISKCFDASFNPSKSGFALFNDRFLLLHRDGAINLLLDLINGESLLGYEYFRGTSDLLTSKKEKLASKLVKKAGKKCTLRRIKLAREHIERQRNRHYLNARRLIFEDSFADEKVRYSLTKHDLNSALYHATLPTGVGISKRIFLNKCMNKCIEVEWSFEYAKGELGIDDFITEGVFSPSIIGLMDKGPESMEVTQNQYSLFLKDKNSEREIGIEFEKLEYPIESLSVHYGIRFEGVLRQGVSAKAELRYER